VVSPRILVVPPCVSTRGDEAVEFVRSVGLGLDDWQEFFLEKSLGVDADGRWAADECGLTLARQNGKTVLSVARAACAAFLFEDPLTIHSAHERPAAFEAFLMLVALIEGSSELLRQVKAVRRQAGNEGVDLLDGRRIRYRTRTKGGGRGFACSTLILDESHTLPEASMAALVPMLGTRIGTVWYLGTAVDKTIHEHAIVFSQLRERARSGQSARLCYMEWSPTIPLDEEGREVAPDALSDEFLDDEINVRAANPALSSGRLSLASIALERRALSARAYAVERLSCGDRPTGAATEAGPIPLATWEALLDVDSKPLERLTLAVDINPQGRASFAVAGRREDGRIHVGCPASDLPVEGADLDTRDGLFERLLRFGRNHSVERVLADERILRQPIREKIEDATFELVEPVGTAGYGQACATFVALASEGQLRHVGASRLTDSLKDARARPYGDSFLWSRRLSAGDASPIIAATLAAAAVANAEISVAPEGSIAIH
jgi:hypothetical protein